jgi:hypothetical protein
MKSGRDTNTTREMARHGYFLLWTVARKQLEGAGWRIRPWRTMDADTDAAAVDPSISLPFPRICKKPVQNRPAFGPSW